ncbi:MAG: hypothetical protein EX271_11560, partial [Acidimicrobiales bacterium]
MRQRQRSDCSLNIECYDFQRGIHILTTHTGTDGSLARFFSNERILMIATPLTFFLHILIVVGLGLRIIYRKLAVNTALAWLIIIAALPFFGVGFYFLFGDHKLGRKRLNLGRRIRAYYQKAFGIE